MGVLTALAAIGIVLTVVVIHLAAPAIAHLPAKSNAIIGSVGGGVSLAFVFGNMLPQLSRGGQEMSHAITEKNIPPDLQIAAPFVVSLLGLLAIYALKVGASNSHSASWPLYAAKLVTFGLMNALFAYSVPAFLAQGWDYAALLLAVMIAHTLTRDRLMALDHPEFYRHEVEWVGIFGLAIGLIAALTNIHVHSTAVLFAQAFLAGGLLMTTFRDDLPNTSIVKLRWLLTGTAITIAFLALAGFRAE